MPTGCGIHERTTVALGQIAKLSAAPILHPCLLYCLGDACRSGANSVVSHFDRTVGLVEVEHHHSSAVLQLDGRHVDRRKHVLQRNLHQLNLGRGVLVSEVVEHNLVVEGVASRERTGIKSIPVSRNPSIYFGTSEAHCCCKWNNSNTQFRQQRSAALTPRLTRGDVLYA